MLAKKAAEKARKELEEQLVREAEEKRLQAIPQWKRQLLQKKEETENKIKYEILYLFINCYFYVAYLMKNNLKGSVQYTLYFSEHCATSILEYLCI